MQFHVRAGREHQEGLRSVHARQTAVLRGEEHPHRRRGRQGGRAGVSETHFRNRDSQDEGNHRGSALQDRRKRLQFRGQAQSRNRGDRRRGQDGQLPSVHQGTVRIFSDPRSAAPLFHLRRFRGCLRLQRCHDDGYDSLSKRRQVNQLHQRGNGFHRKLHHFRAKKAANGYAGSGKAGHRTPNHNPGNSS